MFNKSKFRSVRTGFVAFLFFISLSVVFLMAAARAQQGNPLLSSLMPKNAVKVTSQYNKAGMAGMGFAAGKLPFDHVCVSGDKFPGHISFNIKHYSGEGVMLFKMQIGPEEQQRVSSKKSELERNKRGNFRMETVSGGTMLYTEELIDCSEGVKRTKPLVDLLAVAHNDNTAIHIEIKGFISAELAKAAAVEVLGNFRKANFSALD